MTNQKFTDLLAEQIPHDSSQQINSEYYIQHLLQSVRSTQKVLDLGCGEGNSEAKFKACSQDMQWYGLDIDESPEVNSRTKEGNFYTFDGINIPFDDNYFDLIYSKSPSLPHMRDSPEGQIARFARLGRDRVRPFVPVCHNHPIKMQRQIVFLFCQTLK